MTTKFQRFVIVAVVVGGALLTYIVMAILLVDSVDRFGMAPIYAAMSPHNAYVLWRARRDITWQGIRIRVGTDYVLEPEKNRVRVHHVDSLSILILSPGMSFIAADPERMQSFRKAESRCRASVEDDCTILQSTLRSGVLTCHRNRGRRARPTYGQFELWSCEDANGLSAVFFGTPEECRQRSDIALRAFATATRNSGNQSRDP